MLLIVGILGTAHLEVDPGDRAPDAFAYLLVVLGIGSLAFWRRWSIVVTGVVAVVFAVYSVSGYRRARRCWPGHCRCWRSGTAPHAGWRGSAVPSWR